jgi:hypothetical protein
MACLSPGRDGKAGSPIELESWAAWISVARSGLSVTAPDGVQLRV